MSKELIIMIVYDINEPKNKCDMFVADNFKDLYKKRDEYKNRKDIKFINYKIFQKIEEN